MILLADTNFLIYLSKYKIAHEVEKLNLKIIIPSQVVKELKKKSTEGKREDKEAAHLALILLKEWEKRGHLSIKDTKAKSADDAILLLALENKGNCFVATHDKELMKKLKKAKIALIGVKQKKFLERK